MPILPLTRILIVEDEPDIQAIAQLALEAVGGFTTKVCSSGADALLIAPDFAPDLILLDVMMPGMDGLTTLQALRELPATAATPVMFITAKVQPQEIAQYRERGALDVIPKPFDPMTLAATISAAWERHQADSPAGAHERFTNLRARYTARIQEKIEQIETTWHGLTRGAWDDEAAQTLQRMSHNLVGSGATFGFPMISERARALDVQLKAAIERAVPPATEQRVQIDLCIVALKQAYHEIHTSAPAVYRPPASARYPLNNDHQATAAANRPPAAAAAGADNRLICLVTDSAERAQDLGLQVGYFGYAADIFMDMGGLADTVEQTRPAAIVVETALLHGDGAEALAAVRRVPHAPPVFFISPHDDVVTRLQAVQAGGEAYFTAPVNIGGLIDKLDTLTARQELAPYRILIIDDEAEEAQYYALTLERAGMTTAVITEPLQVMHALVEFLPDLILMDMYMPDCSGLELAAVIRQLDAYVSIPIVFLSMEDNLDMQLEAIHIGGDDFLTKPIQPDQLILAVKSRVKRSMILRSLMVRDSLTGLLKHTILKERLEVEIARAQRQGARLVFAMIDIDRFKLVNDTHGHATGDRVIKSLARLLQQRLRKSDVIGRYGGEEFAVILPDTQAAAGLKVLGELRTGFAHIRHQSGDAMFYVTFSCGVAEYPQYTDAGSLIAAADRALYEAKHAGRNLVLLAEP
jgi:diguanylate cyclase (GGDEF)-like protein